MKVKKIIGQCPGGTHESSPVIDGWGREIRSPHASRRDVRTQGYASRSSVPLGRCEGGGFRFPAMNHWATLRGPSGARPLQNALSGYLLKTHNAQGLILCSVLCVLISRVISLFRCEEGWLIVFDRRKTVSWDKKIFWKTSTFEGKTLHIVGC